MSNMEHSTDMHKFLEMLKTYFKEVMRIKPFSTLDQNNTFLCIKGIFS